MVELDRMRKYKESSPREGAKYFEELFSNIHSRAIKPNHSAIKPNHNYPHHRKNTDTWPLLMVAVVAVMVAVVMAASPLYNSFTAVLSSELLPD